MEVAIVFGAIAAAVAFAAWRVWHTLRVARGQAESTACGGCSKGCSTEHEATRSAVAPESMHSFPK